MEVDDAPEDEGEGAPRQSYNFAPGYHGVVYRADVPDRGAGPSRERQRGGGDAQRGGEDKTATDGGHSVGTKEADDGSKGTGVRYKLQSMKWGLIPFWTKRNPDYASVMKTINCRDDSLAAGGGMWASMKGRKRCIVVAQGFYEWLRPGGPGTKEKVPHYVKRKDGKLMCFAGLWDCVRYEDEEQGVAHYTYTVITTDSNKQLKFLHDRMPVILDPGSEEIRTWLDPNRYEWNSELQGLLKPYAGELEVYAVSKEVGKVGNNSPSFIIPVASKENKNNIANFFAKGVVKKGEAKVKPEVEIVKKEEGSQGEGKVEKVGLEELEKAADDGGMGSPTKGGIKREATSSPGGKEPPVKKLALSASPSKSKMQTRGKISATSNPVRSPQKRKAKSDGSQKITKFFGNSA